MKQRERERETSSLFLCEETVDQISRFIDPLEQRSRSRERSDQIVSANKDACLSSSVRRSSIFLSSLLFPGRLRPAMRREMS